VEAFGSCDEVNTYAPASALYCPGTKLSCGATWYALCDGTDFVACSCSVPSGFDLSTGYNISASCSGSACSGDGGSCVPPGGTTSDELNCCGTTVVPKQSGSKVICFVGPGGACKGDSDCSSNICTGGMCELSPLGGQCITIEDCHSQTAGIICNNGTCANFSLDGGTMIDSGAGPG